MPVFSKNMELVEPHYFQLRVEALCYRRQRFYGELRSSAGASIEPSQDSLETPMGVFIYRSRQPQYGRSSGWMPLAWQKKDGSVSPHWPCQPMR
jgi:hypothetical protein